MTSREIAHRRLDNTIVVDGQIAVTWRRTLERRAVAMKTKLFRRLTKTEIAGFARAADRYGVFHRLPVLV